MGITIHEIVPFPLYFLLYYTNYGYHISLRKHKRSIPMKKLVKTLLAAALLASLSGLSASAQSLPEEKSFPKPSAVPR